VIGSPTADNVNEPLLSTLEWRPVVDLCCQAPYSLGWLEILQDHLYISYGKILLVSCSFSKKNNPVAFFKNEHLIFKEGRRIE
jgi:hypothetical protein